MRRRLICSLIMLLGLSAAAAEKKPQWIGEWKLSAMIYRGQSIPLPNPDLYLSWSFFPNGTERLYWDRGGAEFCERFAHYSISNDYLQESTFAINPQNAMDCAQDPDMQVGRETKTQIQVLPGELRLKFQMGEEDLIYVLKSK